MLQALGNAALPAFLSTIDAMVDHLDSRPSGAAIRALRRYPSHTTDHIFRRVLAEPASFDSMVHSGRSSIAISERAERRALALGIVAHQRHPQPWLLGMLRSHLEALDAVHGEFELGCLERCWNHCSTDVPECVTRCLHGTARLAVTPCCLSCTGCAHSCVLTRHQCRMHVFGALHRPCAARQVCTRSGDPALPGTMLQTVLRSDGVSNWHCECTAAAESCPIGCPALCCGGQQGSGAFLLPSTSVGVWPQAAESVQIEYGWQ